ncbi:alpha/beta hydrolase [Rubritalea marina]|uniref:alpha/beta hydrolase n=1 Tax=Rubritalea marina TaxID=361055 RepID=UPI00038098E1|nr:alpha/beta hydrolase [Rubritalea marina]
MEASNAATPPIAVIRDEELLQKATKKEYTQTPEGPLYLHIFEPKNHVEDQRRSAIIFFHGGNWDQSMVTQFAPQAINFASLGMIAIVAEYRTSSQHDSNPIDAVEDAQNAILWMRQNHHKLGINPEKIVAAGSGSGAHLALCAALHKRVIHDESHTSKPNALILWSALIDTTKHGNGMELFTSAREARLTSPTKNVRRKSPPMIFFHGQEDPFIPIQQVERFCSRLSRKKNDIRFVPYSRATHSFFNFNVNQHYFISTLEAAEAFLHYHHFLEQTSNPSELEPQTYRTQPRS